MNKRGAVNYLVIVIVAIAFISIVAYGVDEYTGFAVKYVSCSDSDNGVDYYTSGSVSATRESGRVIVRSDSCRTGKRLREWYCDGNTPRLETFYCDKGCSKGACIGEFEEITPEAPRGRRREVPKVNPLRISDLNNDNGIEVVKQSELDIDSSFINSRTINIRVDSISIRAGGERIFSREGDFYDTLYNDPKFSYLNKVGYYIDRKTGILFSEGTRVTFLFNFNFDEDVTDIREEMFSLEGAVIRLNSNIDGVSKIVYLPRLKELPKSILFYNNEEVSKIDENVCVSLSLLDLRSEDCDVRVSSYKLDNRRYITISFEVYLAEDGSSYYDRELTKLAAKAVS